MPSTQTYRHGFEAFTLPESPPELFVAPPATPGFVFRDGERFSVKPGHPDTTESHRNVPASVLHSLLPLIVSDASDSELFARALPRVEGRICS